MPAAYLKCPVEVFLPRRSGCSGKVAYASRADAVRAVETRNIRGDTYCCRHCSQWHNSSPEGSRNHREWMRALRRKRALDAGEEEE